MNTPTSAKAARVTDDKSAEDAPAWYSAEEASAWASGYNSALASIAPDAEPVAYTPCIIHYEEADRSELVLTDEAHIYGDWVIVTAVRRMEDRSLIGFAWDGVEPPAAPLPAKDAEPEAVTAARALLKEAETWAGHDHGDRAMRLLPALIKCATGEKP